MSNEHRVVMRVRVDRPTGDYRPIRNWFGMGLRTHLRHIEANLGIMKEFPELDGRMAILGESDPEGCAACSARYTRRNGYRNGPPYGAYVVESLMRTYELSHRAGIEIEGTVTCVSLQTASETCMAGKRLPSSPT
jgi:hypothetical protein